MTTRIGDSAANAALNAIAALLNTGGYVEFRSGSQPATPGTAATGTLLGTMTLSSTAFGSASARSATANAIANDTSADNSGTAGWFRAYTSGAVAVVDGSIGTSGADMIMASTAIVAGGVIAISSWVISM